MSRCVIISACPVTPELAKALRPDDFIIACDAGYRNCVPLGCKPDIILGDFDTAPCPEKQDDDIIVLPHVKDDTDTEYAAKLASEKGFDEVLLLGGLFGVLLKLLFRKRSTDNRLIVSIAMLFAFAFAMAGVNPIAVAGAGREMNATSLGVMLPVAGIGAIVMPWLIGVIADRVGLVTGMFCNLIPCVGILVFSVLILKYQAKN